MTVNHWKQRLAKKKKTSKGKTLKIVSCHCMLLPAASLSAAQRKLCCLRWIIYSESCIEQEEWARNKEGRGRPWICKKQEIGFQRDKKCSNVRRPNYIDNIDNQPFPVWFARGKFSNHPTSKISLLFLSNLSSDKYKTMEMCVSWVGRLTTCNP